MVKSGHKKFVKKEKSKVKLKVAHKTVLPKGQNVTNTNFKVRKIVLPSQLKERGVHEILSKGNLNIKVCTSHQCYACPVSSSVAYGLVLS